MSSYVLAPILAEIAGVPDSFALPISIVATVVLFLVGIIATLYKENRALRTEHAAELKARTAEHAAEIKARTTEHTAYVENQLAISRVREQAQDEKNEKQAETIAKLTAVAELLSQRSQDPRDPRNRGSGGSIR